MPRIFGWLMLGASALLTLDGSGQESMGGTRSAVVGFARMPLAAGTNTFTLGLEPFPLEQGSWSADVTNRWPSHVIVTTNNLYEVRPNVEDDFGARLPDPATVEAVPAIPHPLAVLRGQRYEIVVGQEAELIVTGRVVWETPP